MIAALLFANPVLGDELLVNGGFESGLSSWSSLGNFHADPGFPYPHTGSRYAYLANTDGTAGNLLVGEIRQTVTIPASATSARLSFWFNVTSQDTSSTFHDLMFLRITDASGNILTTLGTYSNMDSLAPGHYLQSPAFDLLSYRGQTIGVSFLASTDSTLPTVFRVDDVSLTVSVPPAPQISLGPTSLNFGNVQVGGCSTAQFAIQHAAGTAPASGTLSVSPNPPYSLSTTSFDLSNGSASNITVTFCPTSNNLYTGSVIVSSPGTTLSNGNTVQLSGTGVSSPPQTGTVQVQATLNGSAWPGSVNYSLSGASSFSGSSVPSDFQNRTAGTYTLSYLSGGPAGASLSSITPSSPLNLGSGGVITFTLNFSQGPPTPQITVGPTALTFGDVQVGSCSPMQLTIQHVAGTGASSGTVSASPIPPFSLTQGASFIVSNGQAASATVQFCPTSAGPFSGTAVVTAPGTVFTGANTVSLSGNGVTVPPIQGTIKVNATLNGSPWTGALSYNITGPLDFSGSSVPTDFQNRPVGAYTLTNFTGGPAGATFAGLSPSATQTLNQGGVITFTFLFQQGPPQPPGAFSASSNLSCSQGSPVVSVSWGTSSGAESYVVYRNNVAVSGSLGSTVRSFDDSGVSAGGSYAYVVKATAGNLSTNSSPATTNVPANPCGTGTQPPGSFTLTAKAYCNTQAPTGPAVLLTWTASANVTSYKVYRDGNPLSNPLGPEQLSFDNNAGVAAGRFYQYFVRASADSLFTDSNTATVTVPANVCPTGPQGITFEAFDPHAGYIDQNGVINNPSLLSAMTQNAVGAAADGVTRVVVRATVPGPGTVIFSLKGGVAPQDGGFAALGQQGRASSVSVPAVSIRSGVFMAFAIYQTPDAFTRPNTRDGDAPDRPLTFIATFQPAQGASITSPDLAFKLVRPPVVFIPGLMHESDAFTKFPLASDSRFPYRKIAYYTNFNTAPFQENLTVPIDNILAVLKTMRNDRLAATQADVVAHSMGGILARLWADPAADGIRVFYLRGDNYFKGDIHRLITLDTPHAGSPWANALTSIRLVVDLACQAYKHSDCIGSPPTAFHDLSVGSAALGKLHATPVPSHAIVGIGGSDNTVVSLECANGIPIALLYSVLKTVALETPSSIFLGNHDLIVGQASQEGGMPQGKKTIRGGVDGIHTENQCSAEYSQIVADLLNASDLGSFSTFSGKAALGDNEEVPVPTVIKTTPGALVVSSPQAGTSVRPGNTVRVTVSPRSGIAVDRVLVVGPGVAEVDTKTPFQFDIRVPVEALGTFALTAIGHGPKGDIYTSSPLSFRVAGSPAVESLAISPGELTLPTLGATQRLIVHGTFTDGVDRDVTRSADGTSYSSSDSGVATVSADGLVTAVGPGSATITAANGSAQGSSTVQVTGGCVPSSLELCLTGKRFKVSVVWADPFNGGGGVGTAVPLTSDTGYFWFFGANNAELVVKVLDGRALNHAFWVFYGALSNVEYWITVTDTATGAIQRYHNPPFQLASQADTVAFPVGGTAASAVSGSLAALAASLTAPAESTSELAKSTCGTSTANLCLNDNRFRVRVSWRTNNGNTGEGTAIALTGDSGYFWFFGSANVELLVKVLDGRSVNGKFWVFFGALSNVEYTVYVTDTFTGQERQYHNAPNQFSSQSDTQAF